MKKSKNKKVIVAMSGGLDSSVAAALLKKEGFNVVGVFMKFWSPKENGILGTSNRCCSPEAEIRARKIAKILKIPFYVFDVSKEFKRKIVDYFLLGHKEAITPNPCVICNKEIKFGILLQKALNLNFDHVATGHYAKIKKNGSKFSLLRAKDKEKDQSYFLWMLSQNQLKRILFPIGNYKRCEVEEMAKKFKLFPVLGIKKSVEICFVNTNIKDFLKKYLKEKRGKIMDKEGKILGEHKGIWFYTIGQRRGLNLAGGPWWVLSKDKEKNALIVTKNEKDLLKKNLICQNVNWISGEEPKLPQKVKAKIRYQQNLTEAKIEKKLEDGCCLVSFKSPQRAITPGQSVVFYKGEEVLGGGIIS